MTVYVRKFEGNATISFKINDKQLLKSTINYGKQKIEKLWKIEFDSKTVCDDDDDDDGDDDDDDNDKYIKTKNKNIWL